MTNQEQYDMIWNNSIKGRCKDCKYFEYDSAVNVKLELTGVKVPLIVTHEICKKWGNGCKTREDGYCFQFESCGMDINTPTTDTISKQAALNILDDMVKDYINENDFDKAQGVAWVKVQKLPNVNLGGKV